MGYHVTILRTINGDQQAITPTEVQRATATLSGWKFDLSKREASFVSGDEVVITLWLDEGELWAKNPSDGGLAVMIELAPRWAGESVGMSLKRIGPWMTCTIIPMTNCQKQKPGLLGRKWSASQNGSV